MGDRADQIIVGIVDAQGNKLRNHVFKAPAKSEQLINTFKDKYGVGDLLDTDGYELLMGMLVQAGLYEYRVTGAGGFGSRPAGETAALAEILADLKVVKEKLEPLHDDAKSWHSSQALEASKIRAENIYVLRRLLKVMFVPDSGMQLQDVLSEGANDNDFEWDNTPEPALRDTYMQSILQNIGQAFTSRSVSWKHQITAKLLVKGLGHQVVARSDELVCARTFHNDPSAGALVGVELKKRLSYAARRQGEAEFYTFSLTSNFPFVQVVTDMKRGGFAYWKAGVQDGQQVVREKILLGMPAVYDFLRDCFEGLPRNIGQDDGNRLVLPSELTQPVRCKLLDPLVHTLHPTQVSMAVEKGDEGNDALDDLLPWYAMDQLRISNAKPACLFGDGIMPYYS